MVVKSLYGDKFQVLDIASDTSLVPSDSLRADLMKCCIEDNMASRKSDTLKRVTGEPTLHTNESTLHMSF